MSVPSHIPKDAKIVAASMKEMGIEDYEERIINQTLEFAYRHMSEVLEDALKYASFGGRKGLEMEDVRLASDMKAQSIACIPPSKEVLLAVAKEKNNVSLPVLKSSGGLRLPPDRYCLLQPSYRLKKGIQQISSAVTASSAASIHGLKIQPGLGVQLSRQSSLGSQHATPVSSATYDSPSPRIIKDIGDKGEGSLQGSAGRQTFPGYTPSFRIPDHNSYASDGGGQTSQASVQQNLSGATASSADGRPLFRLISGGSKTIPGGPVKRKFGEGIKDPPE